MNTTHAYITFVAERTARREVEALADYFGLGQLIVSKELTYDVARDQLVEAFESFGLKGSTAKTYVSQGFALAQLFDTFADVELFADDECAGSRSLKRIYDATKDEPATGPGESAPVAEVVAPTPLVDVILANLANLKDAGEIARVRDAASAMLALIAA
jgi:hypothetical protein